MPDGTWNPITENGEPISHADLPDSVFAYPWQRKELLTGADHVRAALAHFHEAQGVCDAERDGAFANIKKAEIVDLRLCRPDLRQAYGPIRR